MLFTLAILYYFVAIGSFVTFFYFFKKYKMQILSFSVISYLASFFLAIIPGYFIATGQVFLLMFPRLYRGFDLDVYTIYLLFSILMPASLFFGRLISNRYEFTIPTRLVRIPKIAVISIAVIIYALLYYMWLPVLPINEAIHGTMKGIDLVVARVSITHQLGSTYSVPRFFGYWRPIIQPISIALFIFWINFLNLKKIRNIILIILAFLFVLYGQVFTLEKATLIYFFVAIMISFLIKKKIQFSRSAILLMLISIPCMLILFYFFMGVEPKDLIRSMVHRFMVSTSSIYDQILYMEKHGLFFIDNIHMNYVNEEPISTSLWSFERLYPQSVSAGAIGTSGGLSLANLYFSFSYLGTIVFSIVVICYGFFDGILLSLYLSEGNKITKDLHLAVYSVFCGLYMLVLMNNVFYIFEFPTLVSRYFYPVVFLYIIIFKVESLRICKRMK